MNSAGMFLEPTSKIWLEAALNSLGPGLLILLAAHVFLHFFRRANSATRYFGWWIVLLLVISLPISHCFFHYQRATGFGNPARDVAPLMIESQGGSIVEQGPQLPLETSRPKAAVPLMNAASPRVILLRSGNWLQLVFVGWLVISGLLLIRIFSAYLWLHTIKQRAEPFPDSFQKRWKDLATSFRIRRRVKFQSCKKSAIPMAAGFFRPAILIPERLAPKLSDAELDQIILHELAHLRRWDDWTNGLQQMLAAVFWFHPAVPWIARQLRLEREIACDDWVLAMTGQAKPYAICLTKLMELSQFGVRAPYAPGAWITQNQLTKRIGMLLDRQRNSTTRLDRTGMAAAIVLAAISFGIWMRLSPVIALGQEPKPKSSKTTEQEAYSKLREAALAQREQATEKPAASVPVLKTLLKIAREDADPGVRQAAIESIASLGHPLSLQTLMEIATNDKEVEVRKAAMSAIAGLGSADGVHALSSIYNESKEYYQLKQLILNLLGNLHAAGSQETLLAIAQSEPDPQLRKSAVQMLQVGRQPSFVPKPDLGSNPEWQKLSAESELVSQRISQIFQEVHEAWRQLQNIHNLIIHVGNSPVWALPVEIDDPTYQQLKQNYANFAVRAAPNEEKAKKEWDEQRDRHRNELQRWVEEFYLRKQQALLQLARARHEEVQRQLDQLEAKKAMLEQQRQELAHPKAR